MREVIVTGKTVEEATEKACLELGLPREEVSIEILEMPTRKLFKSTPAKVKATADEAEAPAVEEKPAPQPVKAEAKKEAPKAPEKRPPLRRRRRTRRSPRPSRRSWTPRWPT